MLCWGTLGLISLLHNLETSESVRWPAGTYGIPKSASGCPRANGFHWKTGWRSQDTNDKYSNNRKSPQFHLDAVVDVKKVQRSFCIKTDKINDQYRPAWPPGKYCVYKKGTECPIGLTFGYIYWDDDDYLNLNDQGGTLPDGIYDDENTRIEFCCRTDGDKNEPIVLPTKTPFFMLAYESAKCQMVKWAIVSPEWIYYDTEHSNNGDTRGGAYPYEAGKQHPTIHYCYYRGCNETLTAVNSTFHTPNYPRKYPDGQYCSWRITVSQQQLIHLTFTNFSLQSENNTDTLYVYDGENATGEVLGVFYGGHPPPKEGIYSSSNHLFIIFKSDKNGSDTGFSASYSAVNYSEPTVATTTTHTQEVTPSTLNTLQKTTTRLEPKATTDGPSKESGKNDQRQKSQGKGMNMVAVVVPVVVVVFLVALLVAGLFFYKRRKTKKEEQGTKKEVVYSRSNDETSMSLENPYYDSGLIIESTACSSEENELYTAVKEETKNEEETFISQENENPLYESAGGDAALNPIYDSSN